MNDWLWSLYWFLLCLFWTDMFLIQLLLARKWQGIAETWADTSEKWKELYFNLENLSKKN